MKLRTPLRFLRLTLLSSYLQPLTTDAMLRQVKSQYPLTHLLNKFIDCMKNPIQINFQSPLRLLKRIKDFTRYQMQAIDVESLQTSFQNSLQRLGELTRYRVGVNIVDPLEVVEENKQKEAEIMLLKQKAKLLEPKPVRQEEWEIFEKLEVPIHKMPRFYGLGEFNTKKFTDETGLELTLLENGNFCVISRTSEMEEKAKEIIENLLTNKNDPELEYNGIYTARIAELRFIIEKLNP